MSEEDFHIVDDFIDVLAPEYSSADNLEIKKARRAWGRILKKYGRGSRKI
jgi:hypothetical protein